MNEEQQRLWSLLQDALPNVATQMRGSLSNLYTAVGRLLPPEELEQQPSGGVVQFPVIDDLLGDVVDGHLDELVVPVGTPRRRLQTHGWLQYSGTESKM